jgi:cellulose synthase (UDP-forming)
MSATPHHTRPRRTRLAHGAGWLLALLATALFVAQPISVSTQSALSAGAIIAMAVIWMAFRGPLARMAFLATGSLVVLRYLYWRTTSTLPSISDPVGFTFGIILFGAELYCVGFLAINLVINADPMRRKPALRQPDADLPTVDIFVPSYNEEAGILAATLSAAKMIDYPPEKLTVWLLDDGGTDQKCGDSDPVKSAAARDRRASLTALCGKLGVKYLTRARNEHAKAGNLNAGLKASQSEIVVVLDADHVPFRPFLRETIGHFAEDPRLFLVQTPHVFLNPDPLERNLQTFDRMPSENEMFYSMTQRGLDKWNGSFFCGSAALLRRAALMETGGFSGVTITEDCETAFELHSRGWTSIYVDTPLIAGLQPETFDSFIGQRSRWCQGMFQIMMLKNPILKRGLKPIQRLAYLSSMMYWLFPLPRLIFMFAPMLHIFFDVRIFTSSIDETIAYTASYMVVNVMIQSYLFGHVRWPWVSELYEYVQGMFLLGAIASVVMSPRKPTFNVTAKGISLDNDHLSPLAWPFVAAFLLIASSIAMAGYRYAFEPGVTNLMLVVGLWSTTNLVIAGAALGVVAERRQTEVSSTLPIARTGTLCFDGARIDVDITRVSAVGCQVAIKGSGALPPKISSTTVGQLLVMTLDGRPQPAPFDVRLDADDTLSDSHALVFEPLQPEQYFSLAELMYADGGAMQRFLGARRQRKSFIKLSLQFILWGFQGPVRALLYGLRPAVHTTVVAEGPVSPAIPDAISEDAARLAARVADARKLLADLAGAIPAPELTPHVVAPVPKVHGPLYEAWMQSLLAFAASEPAGIVDEAIGRAASLRVA